MELVKQQKHFLVLLFAFLLSACETHLDTEEMRIIGNPPTKLYYDSLFEFEFGASGGNGKISMRYIPNPDPEVEPSLLNTVELDVVDVSRAKPAFLLTGTPQVEPGEDFDNTTTKNFEYRLEVSDGAAVVTRDFEFSLSRNRVIISSTNSLSATEQRVNDGAAIQLAASLETGNDLICSAAGNNSYEPREVNGTTVYPATYQIDLEVPVASRTELFYEFTSDYDESLTERDEKNIGKARPNVDFLAETKSVVFEPGTRICLIELNVLDDNIPEGLERLQVEFVGRLTGQVAFDGVRADVRISDNEPTPRYSFESTTVNEGEEVVATVSLTRALDIPLAVNVVVDLEESTADIEDYEIVPPEAVLNFVPGETEASFSIRLLNNDDGPILRDEVLVVDTDIGELRRVDPMEITINKWPRDFDIDNEIVARGSSNEAAVAFDVDDEGRVAVLIEDSTNANETSGRVEGYFSDGTHFNVIAGGDIQIARSGIDVIPKGIAIYSLSRSDTASGTHTLAIVAEVNGLFGAQYYGGTDFVVFIYESEFGDEYSLVRLDQYGTEGNDVVHNVEFDRSGNLFVYGQTDGTVFDGAPGTETNNGGQDGFLYRFSSANASKQWSRFIGTVDDDLVKGIAPGRSDLYVLGETQSTDIDGFVDNLSSTSGETKDDVDRADLRSFFDDNMRDIELDSEDSSFWVLSDSPVLLPTTTSTPSFSRDVLLTPFAASNTPGSNSESVGSIEDDFAGNLKVLLNSDYVALTGETAGVIDGNVAKGSSGNDVFFSSYEVAQTSNLSLESTLQFGTSGNDQVIDLKETEGRKVLVLWSEDSSSGDGSLVYRLSPFTPEGRKLSLDP